MVCQAGVEGSIRLSLRLYWKFSKSFTVQDNMERTQHKPAKQFNVVYKFAKLTSETTFIEHELENTRLLTMKN